MTAAAPPGDPRLDGHGPAARRLLDERDVLVSEPADFAKNRRFDRPHGESLDSPERPVVLLTARPSYLLDHGNGTVLAAGVYEL